MPRSSTVERGAMPPRGTDPAHSRPAPARVVIAMIDGLALRHVNPIVTPTLHRLRAEATTIAPALSVLTSSPTPNITTFATGVDPTGHAVFAEKVMSDGGVVGATQSVRRLPSLFDACAMADRSAAWSGDVQLGRFLGAVPANGVSTDADAAQHAAAAFDCGVELIALQLVTPDVAGRMHHADSDEAKSAYHATDHIISALYNSCMPNWGRTIFIAVSSHDQIGTCGRSPVELRPLVDRLANASGTVPSIAVQGDAAVLHWDDTSRFAADFSPFDEVPGVEGRLRAAPGVHIIWAPRGQAFCLDGSPDTPPASIHGGPYTRAQVAIVSGGHPFAAAMQRSLGRRAVRASDWAPTIADALGVALPTATGVSLIEPAAMPRPA